MTTETWRGFVTSKPLAEYAVIPAAGHASNLDNPAVFTAMLEAFLDRVLPPVTVVEEPSPQERVAEPSRPDELDSGTG